MAEPGDLIEIERGAYCHWAVYVGDGYIIHATKNDSNGDTANVSKDKLKDVAAGNRWSVNNSFDNEYKARSPECILKEAEEMVGKQFPYSLLGKNCEHFATNLRYGVAKSRQVLKAVKEIVAGSSLGHGALGMISALGVSAVGASAVGVSAVGASAVGASAAWSLFNKK